MTYWQEITGHAGSLYLPLAPVWACLLSWAESHCPCCNACRVTAPPRACSGLATTTHQIEGFRQALPSYLDVLRLRPGHVPFVRVLSGLVHAGEIDEARAVLNRALQFSDDENLRQRRELLP